MKAAQSEKIRLSKTLSVLLSELEEECLNAIKLSAMLKMNTLTEEQIEDLIGELSASVTHLKVHSEQLEHALDKELDGQ
jgi:hypothetical protein